MPPLRTAAQQAYEMNSGYAPAWYYLYRWSRLLGTPYNQAIHDWIRVLEAAKAGHPNMPASYAPRPGSLSAGLSRELLVALLGNTPASAEFFQLLSPLDNPSEVLAILQKIHQQDPALFTNYVNLALAIAVVYDVPPPAWWPHGQVKAVFLPRTLPAPEQVFAYFVRLDRTNVTLQRLNRLPSSELKFLVDLVAPFHELDWARQNVPAGLANFEQAYGMIKYRKDRLAANQADWPGGAYTLPAILQQGGICVDQAYFASTAGKAKGIPTILFRGAGLDGRHAWFGYLDAMQRWRLDCGRYAEQKFVVGLAFDPQTWTDINDHELLFITERFRALPTYKVSVMNAQFAEDYLREGKVDQAWKAAREAVNRDSRNLDGWNVLLQAQAAKSPDRRAREGLLREAILAFQKYPDLEIAFSRQLADSLRARGETSLAAMEEQRLGQKYQASRTDLSIEQSAATIKRSMDGDDLATQIRVYNRVVDTSGRDAGADFYDKVVVPFVIHLAAQDQVPAALQALDRAKRTLHVEPGKQMDGEMAGLANRLKKGDFPRKKHRPMNLFRLVGVIEPASLAIPFTHARYHQRRRHPFLASSSLFHHRHLYRR
ncbi:MAG: hypothetical protein WDM96_03790 [Lacunisphaera sp.]